MYAHRVRWRLLAGIAVSVLVALAPAMSQPTIEPVSADKSGALPKFLRGPFIADPDVIARLDHLDPNADCTKSGKLVFACLIQTLAPKHDQQAPDGKLANPFNLRVASEITKTIRTDLADLVGKDAKDAKDGDRISLNPDFFTDPRSQVELVGIVNRIDRQFIKDRVPGAEDHNRCGEVSVIYRFSYSLHTGDAQSRLPVTMNVVFPAVPRDKPQDASNCREIAARWVAELNRPVDRSAPQIVADLLDPATGVLGVLTGKDIERIELNMQAYRIKVGSDQTDFGSTAEYVLRVFRWKPEHGRFEVSYLTNQIDRARLLGNPKGDDNSCDPEKPLAMSKAALQAYLTKPEVLSDIDNGTLNIEEKYLACRATTVSPGGPHRSKNQAFWNAPTSALQILSDVQITAAMKKATSPTRQFSFMKSADDVRTRLNELTCSGCHQARAIAGFHFPGADRAETHASNAVLLPGSPHFYGDQPRRLRILQRLADGEALKRHDLAASYAARPLNKFKPELEQTTELLGGWGGACLMQPQLAASQRQWTCKADLTCVALFTSQNAPGVGTCLPPKGTPPKAKQIGDPMQSGTVTTEQYGVDRYLRTDPAPQTPPPWSNRSKRQTLIPDDRLPENPPAENSYYAAHQEYYEGDDSNNTLPPLLFVNKRNAQTGGFPAGALRLSECKGLPPEATCGLLAASGFNRCLVDVAANKHKLIDCFVQRTSYSGVRACEASSPCRDDYICLRPLGYTAENGHEHYRKRTSDVVGLQKPDDFGQKEPDAAWLGRNDGKGDPRGLCIPPYFVFQFRSDGHPSPPTQGLDSRSTAEPRR